MTDGMTVQSSTFCQSKCWLRWTVGRQILVDLRSVCATTTGVRRTAGVGRREEKQSVSRFVVWIWVWVGARLRELVPLVREYVYGRGVKVAVAVAAVVVEA